MTITRKLLIGAAVPAMLLCGCAKKVSFEEFKKAVEEIQIPEGLDVTKIELSAKGKMEGVAIDDSVTYEGNSIEIAAKYAADVVKNEVRSIYSIIFAMDVHEMLLGEVEGITYYAGGSFKVEGEQEKEKFVSEFDKYGKCTYMYQTHEGEEVTLKCSYSYNK